MRRMHRRDAGMVTAETAVVLPVLLLVLAAAVAAIVVVGAQLRCVDAAREGVRAAARGDSPAEVVDIVGRAAPPGSTTSVRTSGETVTVTVTAPVRPLGPVVLRVRVRAAATSELEAGVDGAGP
jgi:Flp pilus assembly protein TadG